MSTNCLEVELEAGEPQVVLLGHAVDRDIDLVDAGLEHRPHALGRNERAVGRGVDVFDAPRLLGVGDHVGKALVQQRLAVLVHAQHFDRLVELGKVVDDLLEHVEFHAPWKRPVSAIMSRWPVGQNVHSKLQELAGSAKTMNGVDSGMTVSSAVRPIEIDARFEPGFHAGVLQSGASPRSYRTMVNRD